MSNRKESYHYGIEVMLKPANRAGLGAAILAFIVLTFANGCGSGGSTPITNCSLDTFTPNYARNVSNLLTWSGFPLTIFFVKDANYTTTRQDIATAGFDQWVSATGGTLSYQVVNSSTDADITVKFDPTTANGLTELHFQGFQMSSADMSIGIKNIGAADIQIVAAHEFGHALGINGHSDVSTDLMYPVHVVGNPGPVTQRDLNTMKTGYCDLFTRAAQPRVRRPTTGPITTVIIQ